MYSRVHIRSRTIFATHFYNYALRTIVYRLGDIWLKLIEYNTKIYYLNRFFLLNVEEMATGNGTLRTHVWNYHKNTIKPL